MPLRPLLPVAAGLNRRVNNERAVLCTAGSTRANLVNVMHLLILRQARKWVLHESYSMTERKREV